MVQKSILCGILFKKKTGGCGPRMKKCTVVIFFLVLLSFSCTTSAYRVTTLQGESSDPNSSLIIKTMTDNFIERSADPFKIVPASQLNAYVMVDRQSVKIKQLGLALTNVRHEGGTIHGQNAWLNIIEGQEMILLVDEHRIALKAERPRIDSKTNDNPETGGVDTSYIDYASYPLSIDDFKTIATAQTIKIKVFGQDAVSEYNEQINAGLLPNLLQFYRKEVEGNY